MGTLENMSKPGRETAPGFLCRAACGHAKMVIVCHCYCRSFIVFGLLFTTVAVFRCYLQCRPHAALIEGGPIGRTESFLGRSGGYCADAVKLQSPFGREATRRQLPVRCVRPTTMNGAHTPG